MKIINYNFAKTKITATHINGAYLWTAFQKDGETCLLQKKYASYPYSNFCDIDVNVDEVLRMKSDESYLYMAVDDVKYIGVRYMLTAPRSYCKYIDKPVDIIEKSVDLAVDNNYLYFLAPGVESGCVAKITKHSKSGKYIETIVLKIIGDEVTNAKSMAIDDNGILWVVTGESPARLVKVNPLTGNFETWSLG